MIKGIWKEYQPVLHAVVVDLLISSTLLLAMVLFHLLVHLLPVPERAAKLVAALHEAGIVTAIGLFSVLLVYDLYQIKMKPRHDR